MEEELKINEERFRSLMQHTAEGFYLFEVPEPIPTDAPPEEQIRRLYRGTIVQCNDAQAGMYGYEKPEDVIGKTLAELHGGVNRPENIAFLRAWIDAGYRITGAASRETDRHGNTVWFANNVVGVVEDGHLTRIWGTQTDVTERIRAEEDLRREKERAQEYLDIAGTILVALNRHGEITLINKKGCELLEYGDAGLIGQNWFDRCLPQADRETVKRVFSQHIAGNLKPTEYFENPVLTRSGTERLIAWHNTILRDKDGNLIGTLSSGEDITDRRKAEEALRESEERFRQLAEAIPEVFWVGTPAWDNVLYVSPAYEKTWGRPCQELYERPRSWLEAVVEEDRDALIAVIESRHPDDTTAAVFPEYRIVRPDGSMRWIAARAFPIQDRSGNVYRIAGVAQDITERKRAEEALRESEETAQALMNASPDGAMLIDRNGMLLALNAIAAQRMNKDVDELAGTCVFDAFTPEVAASRRAWHDKILRTRKAVRDEDVRAGRTYDTQVCPILDASGQVVRMAVFARDITERRQAEQERRDLEAQLHQAQKMEAIGQLAGGVAHDFNNVLTAILGNSERLVSIIERPLEENKSKKLIKEGLEEVMSAAHRAAALTRQLLTLGRKGMTRDEVLSPGQVMRNEEDMLRRILREDIALSMKIASETRSVRADPAQLGQVILNLVLNARDAMPEGGTLTVTCCNADVDEVLAATRVDARPGPHVVLAVSDTGIGMTKETTERMFEPFFTTKPMGKGTGLGLATVYGILKRAGAHVTVQSEPGKGTTVNVYFPAVAEEIKTQKPPDAGPTVRGEGLILVCEDEGAVRRGLCQNLRTAGYTVLEAKNGKHALEVAAESGGKIDLLISDVIMPEMNGRELAAAMTSRHPDLRILFISGYTDDVLGDDALAREGANFLQKPFSTNALLRCVHGLLK
jgi:PAS domain S-box-containing protein